MKNLQKIFAWICASLFIVSGVTAMLLFNIEQGAFSVETYKQAFDKQGLYVRIPAILAESIHTSISQDGNSDPFVKELTVSNWEASIAELLPPGELKIISDNALDSIFAYLNNETDSASISLILLKRQIAGPQGVETVKRVLNAQPDCTVEQILQMGLGFLSGKLTLCKPPEEMMGLVTPLIESQLQLMTHSLPDEITLIPSERSNTPDDPRIQINLLRAIMKWSLIFPVMFLIGVTVFTVRSLHDWLNWWGYPLLITGAFSVLLALIGSPILGLVIQGLIQNQGAGFVPPVFISALGETVSAVAGQVLQPVIIEGVILAILGLGMIGTGYFLKKAALQ